MGFKTVKLVSFLACAAVLSACAAKRDLTPHAVVSGPDEFSLVPNKPLQAPDSFTNLPAPTPKGINRADVNPKADAIAALGGRAASGGIDGGIVTYASRYGVDPSIRITLSEADEKKQKRSQALGFGLGRYRYEKAYRTQALDAWAEWERLRALGIIVPSAPAQ